MITTAPIPAEQRLRLSGVPWKTYVLFSDGLGERHIRITYDRGEMEIMTVSAKHENRKTLIARLVEALTEEMAIDIAGFGSMTCRREKMKRGFEPDECYWIENEPLVRGREEIDLEVDPPPDLAMEVEVSRSTMNRLAIYAAMRVPEVWAWNGESLRIFLLTARRTYRLSKRSRAFPFLPLDEFVKFLTRKGMSETQLLRSFRAWVRKNKRKWKKFRG